MIDQIFSQTYSLKSTNSIHMQARKKVQVKIYFMWKFFTPLYVNCCYTTLTRWEVQMKLKYYIVHEL